MVLIISACTKKDDDNNTITDINGYKYHTITIGTQVWMAENLRATKYRNGDLIENVNDPLAWSNLDSGAYCDYDTNSYNSDTYGRLYNWYAIKDSRNIAPVGWHVPTEKEFQTLINYLGGDSAAGGNMKEPGTSHWTEPEPDYKSASESGFNALPAGVRSYDGIFSDLGDMTSWWTTTEVQPNTAWLFSIWNSDSRIYGFDYGKNRGCSVRCIKD